MKEETALSPELRKLYRGESSKTLAQNRGRNASPGQASRTRSVSSGRRKTSKDLVAEIYDRMGLSRTDPMSSAEKFKERYRIAAELSRGRTEETQEELKSRSRSLSKAPSWRKSQSKLSTSNDNNTRNNEQREEADETDRRGLSLRDDEADAVSVKSVKDRRSMFDKKSVSESTIRGAIDPKYKAKLADSRNKKPMIDIYGAVKRDAPSDEETGKNEEPDYFKGKFRKPVLEKSFNKISDNASVGTYKSGKSIATTQTSKSKKMEEFFLKAIGKQPAEEVIVPPPKAISTPVAKQDDNKDKEIVEHEDDDISEVSGDFSYKPSSPRKDTARELTIAKTVEKTSDTTKTFEATSDKVLERLITEMVDQRMSEIEKKFEKKIEYLFAKFEMNLETKLQQMEKKFTSQS